MAERGIQSKDKLVISSSRALTLNRATVVRRGVELLAELDEKQLKVSNKSRRRFLVVDDDASITELIAEVVISYGGNDARSISFKGDSQELLDRVYSEDYDILILGIMMPGINGLELTIKIRNEGLKIPIILMTGYSLPIRAIESMRSGADDLILKPFEIEDLNSSIEAVAKQRSIEKNSGSHNREGNMKFNLDELSRNQSPHLSGLVRDYYQTGKLMAELSYRRGKLNGVSKVYRKWGTLLAEISFRNGVAHGRSRWFNVKGRIRKVEDWENGEYLTSRFYDNTGKVQ
jgi:CheY-like chemotaxis protein